jgi:hypothetical protein
VATTGTTGTTVSASVPWEYTASDMWHDGRWRGRPGGGPADRPVRRRRGRAARTAGAGGAASPDGPLEEEPAPGRGRDRRRTRRRWPDRRRDGPALRRPGRGGHSAGHHDHGYRGRTGDRAAPGVVGTARTSPVLAHSSRAVARGRAHAAAAHRRPAPRHAAEHSAVRRRLS